MRSYSFLKTRSTRKKFNAPLPNPTNKQSINPASLEVNATPIAVATAIKIYMNHFRLLFIIQSGGFDDWLLNIVCKQKTEQGYKNCVFITPTIH